MVKNHNKSPSSSLPAILNENTLKRMAGSKYFDRGHGYFRAGYVKNIVEFDDRITAKVHGTQKYDVNLWIENGGLEYSCSCPLGENGEFCKHCVATGLKWLDQQKPDSGKSKKTKKPKITVKDINNFLLSQDKQFLVDTILEQARYDGQLMHKLVVKTSRDSAKGLDLDAYRSAIDFAVSADDFVDYHSMGEYSRGILDVISSIEDLLNEGYSAEVSELTEYCLAAVEGAMNSVDDSSGDLGYILDRLQEMHLQVSKNSRPDPEKLAKRIFSWELNSECEVFYGASETYADVFGAKGLAVYRELATAEWEKLPKFEPDSKDSEKYGKRRRITRIMEALAKQSRDVEELVDIKSHDLSSPWSFLQIAEIYKKARKRNLALQWAERGVKAFPDRPDSRLKEFLANEYHRAKRDDDAMEQIWAVFAHSANLEHYQLLKTHADKIREWQTWREKALSFIRDEIKKKRASKSWFHMDNSTLVEIFLWEKDIESAFIEAKNGGCSQRLWYQLAKKLETIRPKDSIDIYRSLVEPTLNGKNKRAYIDAINLLKEINKLMANTGRKEEFSKYFETVRSAHKRKLNFMKYLNRTKWA